MEARKMTARHLFMAFSLCSSFCLAISGRILGQDASYARSPQTITNGVGVKLVLIQPGRFTMGSQVSEEGSKEHETLHKVELTKPYYLGTTEVTENQWALVIGPSLITEMVEERDPKTNRLISKIEKQRPNPLLGSQLPKTSVSWEDAVKFCQRLSELPEEKKENRTYRLPTEAEWEYACRAGTSTAYNFGDKATAIGDYAWFVGNSKKNNLRQRHTVAAKKPNALGLYDMHGNMWEWCNDWYGPYPEGFVTDPQGPLVGSVHVRRGGSWDCVAEDCRSAYRFGLDKYYRDNDIGFRVALSQP
jgi:formylglycine-generating enzyme required for sulfatase activity